MSIDINDVFQFGKHKGAKFSDVVLTSDGAGYCCWLREEKRRSGQGRAFTVAANAVIDEAIRGNKSLMKKYKPWNIEEATLEVVNGAIERDARAAAESEVIAEARNAAYAKDWGAW